MRGIIRFGLGKATQALTKKPIDILDLIIFK